MEFKFAIPFAMLLMSGNLLAKGITAQVLSEVPASKQEVAEICRQLPQCDLESAKVFKRQSPLEYYFIDDRPQIVQLTKTTGYQVKQHWDFQSYVHQDDVDNADYKVPKQSIYPAFYPLNEQEWAIALVNTYLESYSGGGRVEEFADFVALKPDGSYQVALRSIDFYSSEMIRACFSEEDVHRLNDHCHDESQSILSIQFKKTDQPYYQWKLIYKETNWPAGNKRPKSKVRAEMVTPFQQN